jgi:hypothetical protein
MYALRPIDPSSKESYRLRKKIKEVEKRPSPRKACRAIDGWMDGQTDGRTDGRMFLTNNSFINKLLKFALK